MTCTSTPIWRKDTDSGRADWLNVSSNGYPPRDDVFS